MQQDDDFNPFPSSTPTRSDLLQSPPIPLVAVALHPENQPNTYSQEEYDKLFRQYDAWKKHAKSLEEGFFAIADMMYETLAFLNAVRLMQGKTPLMITDINAIIESNAVLSQLTNDIRQASIESGYGLVSELVNSQNHLRNGILAQWAEKMRDPHSRSDIAREMRLFQDIDSTRIQDELFENAARAQKTADTQSSASPSNPIPQPGANMHIQVSYQGELHTLATHKASNTQITTDAPVDNGGKGACFSPTDLLATALASCCFTMMAKKAEQMGVPFAGTADVQKIMTAEPRRVAEIIIDFHLEHAHDEKTRSILQATAHACPVGRSLAAELKQILRFHYPEAS